MAKFHKRLLAGLLTAALTITPMYMSPFTEVHAEEKAESETKYEIYPNPHEVTYQNGAYEITENVNVVFENGIDEATRNRLNEVVESKGKTMSQGTDKAEGKTNILVGVYNSNETVDSYVKAKGSADAGLFNHNGSYLLTSDNGEICILGKDTDAAFYGLTSLKHIFNQMNGSEIRNFTIKDYSDTGIRGFIEGYYGIPWSNADRISLMKFGGDFKMTSYVFAPKDDPYHYARWRELYPAAELAELKKVAEAGVASKCRFVWTAHPFGSGFNSGNVQSEINALLTKFEQLYGIGVRQFGVLGDDVGNLNKNTVVQVMTAVSNWAKDKGDVYDTVFCPAGYNHQFQTGWPTYGYNNELNVYDAQFPSDIQIFWTGEAVCTPITVATLDHFRNYSTSNGQRRAPLFWLNWPVNDINMSRLMMGKGSMLHTDIAPTDLAGAVTNPMQDAEASKVALFAVADYTWNVKGFDADRSWADSFKYIDADAGEALHTLAKHMSNPAPNEHSLVLEESEELQPLLNEVKGKLQTGAALGESGTNLIQEMQVIIDACKEFHAKSKNTKLKEELKPFTDALGETAQAIQGFTETELAIESKDTEAAFTSYMNASAVYNASKGHLHVGLNQNYPATPGSTHLIPLAEKMAEKARNDINNYVIGSEGAVTLSATSSFGGFYEGNIENIIDGNAGTYAWYGDRSQVGQYYQVNLSKPSTIYGIHIQNGSTASKPDDTFQRAKLQYTTDGSTWQDVNGVEYGNYATRVDVDITLENVLGVRYLCTVAGDKWPSMREFTVDLNAGGAPDVPEFTMEVIRTTDAEGWTVYNNGNERNMIDGNDSSYVDYAVRWNPGVEGEGWMIPGDYVGVKLSRPITLATIHVVGGGSGSNDYIHNGTLQYSMDGTDWHDIQSYSNQSIINADVSARNIEAQYVRLVQNERQKNWVRMYEFGVTAKASGAGTDGPRVETTGQESNENVAANMIDKNLVTSYKPIGDGAGTITYYPAEDAKVGVVSILQNPSTISGAAVTAQVEIDGEVKEVTLGTLDKSTNDFDTSAYDKVLSVKIEWTEGKVPQIHEIMVKEAADYSAVNAALAEAAVLVESQYTEATWTALQEAVNAVRHGLDASHQNEIDAMAQEIKDAIAGLQQRSAEEVKHKYIVKVNGEVLGTEYEYNDPVTVKAPAAEAGKVFVGWTIDGKVVSMDETYKFFVSNDVEITALFVDAEDAVEEKADVMMTNVIVTGREDTKSDIRFVGQLALPDGYTLVNAGLVWSTKDDAQLVLGGDLKPTKITAISTSNQFSVTIKGLPKTLFLRGRIFATVRDKEGNDKVIYSAEKKAFPVQ